jgi:hypothetical protein
MAHRCTIHIQIKTFRINLLDAKERQMGLALDRPAPLE